MKKYTLIASMAVTIGAAGTMASADSVADFYRGNTVEIYIGYSVGGGYDTYARALARHIGRHIPGNPTVVPQNMPGAGSLVMTNWLFEAAPRDGTVFGTMARGAPFDPLFGNPDATFDPLAFNYIGSMNNEVSVCTAMARTGIETFEDLKTTPLFIGGTGDTADTVQFPRIINAVFGTQMRIINGYPGGNDVVLAMERGELDGRCGWSVSSLNTDWVESGELNILLQMSTGKHPTLPDVPLVMDLTDDPEELSMLGLVFARQTLGRPFLAPPGVPEERVEALRAAFMATLEDPEFLAEAAALNIEIVGVGGAELQQLVTDLYQTDEDTVARLVDILRTE